VASASVRSLAREHEEDEVGDADRLVPALALDHSAKGHTGDLAGGPLAPNGEVSTETGQDQSAWSVVVAVAMSNKDATKTSRSTQSMAGRASIS
jgi:hypothetical protein